jgi:xanthine dehydrogenase small subunit
MPSSDIQFIYKKQLVRLQNLPIEKTLLEVLRDDLQTCDTKEGCAEGDCGACTVVIGKPLSNTISYESINSCIRLAHSIHGMALWTAKDLSQASGASHPVQLALKEHHATQCGFCTPGFAMSLFGLYQNTLHKGKPIHKHEVREHLSGNLCRCTGYRPIMDAAMSLNQRPLALTADETELLKQLKSIPARSIAEQETYLQPRTLAELLQLRNSHPKAQIVAGCTDVGLWVTKHHQQFETIIDVTTVEALQQIDVHPSHVMIGAAVSLEKAWSALASERPQLKQFWHRFAGMPVRNSGTLGGDIANGSPIGDSMPLLIALHAHVVLAHENNGRIVEREIPLEELYTGYRKNCMAANEVLTWIRVPRPQPNQWMRVYKISKRQEDDISAVCLAIQIERDANGLVTDASIGVGGVAATPVRAVKTQACFLQKPFDEATTQQAQAQLQQEFTPISDMRASASYRSEVLVNLLQRAWFESTGLNTITLENLS